MTTEKDIVIEDTSPFATGGFTQVPNFILKDTSISHGAKVVYAMLLSYAWNSNYCFPGQNRLAEDIGTSRQTANKFIQELAQAGVIRVQRRGLGRSNLYTICAKTPVKQPDVKAS